MATFHTLLSLTLFLTAFALPASASRTTKPSKSCPQVDNCLPLLAANKPCPLFPMLPGTYASPPPPVPGYTITTLRPFVHHYSDDAYHALVIFHPPTRRLAVADFPRGAASFAPDGSYRLSAAVAHILRGVPPSSVEMIYSHRHVDHIGAAASFLAFVREEFPAASVRIWATPQTASFLKAHPSTDVPLPTNLTPRRGSTIHITPKLIIRLLPLAAHTSSDLVVHIPPRTKALRDGIVHFVDVVSVGEAPFLSFTLATNLRDYLRAHRTLLKLPFATLSPGHGKIGARRDVLVSLRFARFVVAAAGRAAGGEGVAEEEGGIFARVADGGDVAYRNGAWALGEVLQGRVRRCVVEVVREWGCRLSVVDVFAESHCRAAVLFLFVDQ